MLKKFLGLALVAATALFAPEITLAQSASRGDATPVIEVMGHGMVTKPAEWASITGVVRAEAKDQQTALRLMSAKQDAIADGLSRLAGTKGVKIEAADLSFAPILPPGCKGGDDADETDIMAAPKRGGAPKTCAPTGVTGSVKLSVTVRPAEQLGNMASLAVQLGAEDVQMGDSGVDDQAALEALAASAAYDQALAQAKLLAGAANAHIGRLVRLNRGVPNEGDIRSGVLQVTAPAMYAHEAPPPPITPLVALKLTPAKATESSWVVVEFELVR